MVDPNDAPRPIDRRDFLKTTAAAGLALGSSKLAAAAAGTNDLRVALIGAGNQGMVILESCQKIPNIRITALCDIWTEYRQKYVSGRLRIYGHAHNTYVDIHDMLAKEKGRIDAAIVATPDFWHAEHAIACLNAGLHVYCETEMSNNLEDARRIVRAARESGKLLQIGHERRSNPRYRFSYQKLISEAKLLGRITTASGQWNRSRQEFLTMPAKYNIAPATLEKYGYRSMEQFLNWRWYRGLGGGPIVDLGSHQIDIFNWFLGARPVHRIPLRDSEGEVVRTTDIPLLPFSASHTCGADCHDVKTISQGWHFNTAVAGSAGGRPGEPWILVDHDTGTQPPLSSHAWSGAYRPEEVGITPWAFAKLFGGRTPGGITGEREPSAARRTRWAVSGDLEPNCLVCHDTAAPIFFGEVTVDSPLTAGRTESWKMSRFQKNLDTAYIADFANSFRYRPWLKGTVSAAAGVLLLFLLAYVMPALGRLSAATGPGKWTRVLANVVGVAACGASVASAFPALLSGESLTGYRLMIHVGAAPVFACCAVLVTLFWAQRNRFGRADRKRVRSPFGAAPVRAANPYAVVLRKLFFWIAVAAVIPAVVSATLAMFPALASVRQPVLFDIHRYAVVVPAVSALCFIIFALVGWIRRYPEDRKEAAGMVFWA